MDKDPHPDMTTTDKHFINIATQPLNKIYQWSDQGHRVALATVIETWGSAPRPKGSFLVIRDDGKFDGSVSGGCVEGDVIAHADDVIRSNQVKTLTYGVSNDDAWSLGLACGGKISILLEPVGDDLMSYLKIASHFDQSRTAYAFIQDPEIGTIGLEEYQTNQPILQAAPHFVNLIQPAKRLYIIGAVHIAKHLAALAKQTGFDVTIIDPRSSFLEQDGFDGITLINDWPDDVLQTIKADSHSALVTLTHDPKLDDAALLTWLRSDSMPYYFGCLGSKKTHQARIKRLQDAGIDNDTIATIDGPVGLDIGAKGPEEIAVSILAKLIARYRIKATQ